MVVIIAMLGVAGIGPAHGQAFSPTNLEGTWQIFHLATPKGAFDGSAIGAYRGQITFDATGTVSDASVLAESQTGNSFVLSGAIGINTTGVVTGSLTLTGTGGAPDGTWTLREARMLGNRHTIIGAATILGQVGLFTLAKVVDQGFGLDDIGGPDTGEVEPGADWSYSELTPSNLLSQASSGAAAAWVNGMIRFHLTDGCSQADLDLSDGTSRAQGSGSFG